MNHPQVVLALSSLCLLAAAPAARADAPAGPLKVPPQACPGPGAAAPLFSFPIPLAQGGERASLNALKAKKKPIVLAFWAHNCAPCILEMPALQRLSAEWGDRVSVLLVHVGEDEPKMRDALERWNIKLTSALDESAKKSQGEYCVTALPRLFVLDAKGTVQAALGALGDQFEARVRGEVGKLLK